VAADFKWFWAATLRALCWIAVGVSASLLPAAPADARENQARQEIGFAQLPPAAQATLALIRRGGPFPYARDGVVFGNREHRLPPRQRGWYREYTVPTPGSRDRGERRIVAGEDGVFYYSADHYRTLRRIRE
jgi:ribonuclease T1